jgi:hypothetical protein
VDTNTAFLAYGLHVGSDGQEVERIGDVLDTIKDRCPDVWYVAGGSNQGEQIFLVAYSKEVEPGEYRSAAAIPPERRAGWDIQLAHAIQALGYSGWDRPAWLCFTELS